MSNYSDLEIMRKVQSGDLHLMGILYERHKMNLYSYFYRCTNNRQRSEDLVQNVFLKVLKSTHLFKGTSGEFKYWLFRIARNAWIDNAKSKEPAQKAVSIENQHVKQSYSLDEGKDYEKQRRLEQMRNALNQIAEEKREAIIMSRYQGLDYKTIAKISNCTESAVKSRIMRGLNDIRAIVNN